MRSDEKAVVLTIEEARERAIQGWREGLAMLRKGEWDTTGLAVNIRLAQAGEMDSLIRECHGVKIVKKSDPRYLNHPLAKKRGSA